MSMIAHLTVTNGPDAGREFAIEEELIHIGRGEENHFRLQDDSLAEHQASIAHRTGRFAIYSPTPHAAAVDGNELPAEKWVWLPSSATIRFGANTQVQFSTDSSLPENGNAGHSSTPQSAAEHEREAPVNPPGETSRRPLQLRRKGSKSTSARNVAKFITDRPGVPLVKLGEDGKLPELRLADEGQPTTSRREAKSKSPLFLYGVIGFSFVMSLGMLLVDPGGTPATSSSKAAARSALVEFYGDEGESIERYQELLREADIHHSRGNFQAEQTAYRTVLRMLNSSDIIDPSNLNGLTGKQTRRGRASDEELRDHLEVMLSR